jgi:integrase
MSWGMLDFNLIPGGMISGLNEQEIRDMIDSYLPSGPTSQNSPNGITFFDEDNYLSQELIDEMNELESSQKPKSSQDQMKCHAKKLKDFLKSHNLETDIETMKPEKLAMYLRYFYSSLKKKDGKLYTPASLICFRAGIQRYLTSAPVNRVIDIIDNPIFKSANNMLITMVGRYQDSGYAKSKQETHFPEINNGDLNKLGLYFSRQSPITLQSEVFYSLLYYFGFRGREAIRSFSRSSYVIKEGNEETNFKRFVSLSSATKEKTVKPSLNSHESSYMKDSIMMEDCNPAQCPVKAFEMYLALLPTECDFLFPKCNPNWETDGKWYLRVPVGKTKLGTFMKDLSSRAELSRKYTNHCIRPTVINQLKRKGFSKKQISRVTGHKNSQSLKRYMQDLNRWEDKCAMSSSLTSSLTTSQAVNSFETNDNSDSTLCVINDQGSQQQIINTETRNGSQWLVNPSFLNCSFQNCTFNMK